jgi:hypothetical protein
VEKLLRKLEVKAPLTVEKVDSGAVSRYHDRHNWTRRGVGQLILLHRREFRGDIRSSETPLDAPHIPVSRQGYDHRVGGMVERDRGQTGAPR